MRPERDDFLLVVKTGTTYRILRADLIRDIWEPWRNPGEPSRLDGVEVRVLHFRLAVVRIDPAERPANAMTWDMAWDR